jgi:hypothetical protein
LQRVLKPVVNGRDETTTLTQSDGKRANRNLLLQQEELQTDDACRNGIGCRCCSGRVVCTSMESSAHENFKKTIIETKKEIQLTLKKLVCSD